MSISSSDEHIRPKSQSCRSIPHAKAWGAAYKPTTTRPLLDMSQGVPGTPPPRVLLDALSRASSSPETSGYCHVLGEPTLRSAFAEEMKSAYGREMDVTADDIAITSGCNMAFVATVVSLADAGDEIILPVPWYAVSSLLLAAV